MTDSAAAYRAIFERRSPAEVAELARIKRFMECLVGDPKFRAALGECDEDFGAVTRRWGLEVDPNLMLPLFHTGYLRYRHTEEEARWPLSLAWTRYIDEMQAHLADIRAQGDCADVNPAFHAWRQRQMARTDSALGGSASGITHPIVAYELSEGCSVGCWFCGLSADSFKGAWLYTDENAALWRGVLSVMVDLFGTAAQTGFCYWATDPMDNPDYDRFVADHWEITGFLPQTTTAAPLKDIALTRRVLDLFERHRCVTNRFSVLSTPLLRRIHATFTPDELMGVELVPQMKDALSRKAGAGRARESGRVTVDGLEPDQDHSTIACVSGFLVSMPRRTVQMVAPTRASEAWPLGYRVHEEGRFGDAEDFRALISGMVARHGDAGLRPKDIVALRPDITLTPREDGFQLSNAVGRVTVGDGAIGPALADLLAQGSLTAGEIHTRLISQGHDVFRIAGLMETLFSLGVLDDDPASGRLSDA
jgi:radical SAM family RiPP maturation amino acid epimerase